jgi:hypothetical protein
VSISFDIHRRASQQTGPNPLMDPHGKASRNLLDLTPKPKGSFKPRPKRRPAEDAVAGAADAVGASAVSGGGAGAGIDGLSFLTAAAHSNTVDAVPAEDSGLGNPSPLKKARLV